MLGFGKVRPGAWIIWRGGGAVVASEVACCRWRLVCEGVRGRKKKVKGRLDGPKVGRFGSEGRKKEDGLRPFSCFFLLLQFSFSRENKREREEK